MKSYDSSDRMFLERFAEEIRRMIDSGSFSEAENKVSRMMGLYPDSAVPHNLFGILCGLRGEHSRAMNHFRAAAALDATYRPAEKNLELLGSGAALKGAYFSEKDLHFFFRLARRAAAGRRSA